MLAAQWSVLEVVLAFFGGGILFIFGMAGGILVVAGLLAEAVHRDLPAPPETPVLQSGIRRAARATALSLMIFLCSGAGAFFLLEYFSTADAVCVGCP